MSTLWFLSMNTFKLLTCDLCDGYLVDGRCPYCDDGSVVDLGLTNPVPGPVAQPLANADESPKRVSECIDR